MIVKATRPSAPRATRLRVGNLPYQVTAAELQQLFTRAGPVQSVEVVCYRETGFPRGFAFVVMATPEASLEAIVRFNGFSYSGRDLTVNQAARVG